MTKFCAKAPPANAIAAAATAASTEMRSRVLMNALPSRLGCRRTDPKPDGEPFPQRQPVRQARIGSRRGPAPTTPPEQLLTHRVTAATTGGADAVGLSPAPRGDGDRALRVRAQGAT